MRDDPSSIRLRVLIADDHEGMLRDMGYILSTHFDVVGTATDGITAVEAAARLTPDLIVTDLAMPRLSGIEASRRVLSLRPEMPIVIVTMHKDAQMIQEALSIGIRGFVYKLSAGQELLAAAYAALGGEVFVSPACQEAR
jgi:DNA-binding NarL/FixJ family response regulator